MNENKIVKNELYYHLLGLFKCISIDEFDRNYEGIKIGYLLFLIDKED